MHIFQQLKHRNIKSIELVPNKESPFYITNKTGEHIYLNLPVDEIIGKTAFDKDHWDAEKINFFSSESKKYEKIILIDVGANVGLFSRQCLNKINNIDTLFAYEPHGYNYRLLEKNLNDIKTELILCNSALSNFNGQMILYEDKNNCGNYSLNRGAMWDQTEYNDSIANVINAQEESVKWKRFKKPIFYKSDTQGFDETILTTYETDFWQNVFCVSIELWRIDKPKFEVDKFFDMLNQFPNKSLQHSNRHLLTNDEILKYSQGKDGHHDDLLCWK